MIHLILDRGGDPGIVRQEPHQAQLVSGVFLDDPFQRGVISIGIVVIHADVVSGKGPVVISIGFAIGDYVELSEDACPTGGQVTGQQFVAERVVVFGFGEGDTIVGMVGQAHPKAICLHAMIPLAIFAGVFAMDSGKQAAAGIAGHDIRADGRLELVTDRPRLLDPVQGFTILGARFPPDRVLNLGERHQVPFVGGIDEAAATKPQARFHLHFLKFRARFDDPLLQVETFPAINGNFVFTDQIFKHPLGDMRLERPDRFFVFAIERVLFRILPLPGFGLVVFTFDTFVVFQRDAADHAFHAAVGPTQSPGGQAPQVLARFNDHNGFMESN